MTVRFLVEVIRLAITKLMHMKEAPAVPHRHLANAIKYILDEKNDENKTEHGLYVGGNSGFDSDDVLKTFLDTKELYGKMYGRQGYHYVISFAPGETNPNEAYQMTREFTEKYLGDNYDYVFAVHTDKGHVHSHIIFNSVSRTDGYKYRYVKGDWERYIQPVTDEICVEHGLAPLTFDDENMVGMSYAEWNDHKHNKTGWTQIIRADVDHAVMHSDSFEEFMERMNAAGYSIRAGMSKKHDTTYYTFIYTDEDGKQHRRRSYNMPPGYSPEEITERIKDKSGSRHYENIAVVLTAKICMFAVPDYMKNMRSVSRLYQAVSYYRLPNPYAVPAYKARKDIVVIDRLLDQCNYIRTAGIKDMNDIEKKEKQLEVKIKSLKNMQKVDKGLSDSEINNEFIKERSLEQDIRELKKELLLVRRIKKTEAEKVSVAESVVTNVQEAGTYNNKQL